MPTCQPPSSIPVSIAARRLGIPVAIAKQRQIPLTDEGLQQLLADPPAWLPEAQLQRTAIAIAKRGRKLAKQAARETARAALIAAVQAESARMRPTNTWGFGFAISVLDPAILSLMDRYPESILDAAARELYPKAADQLITRFSYEYGGILSLEP